MFKKMFYLVKKKDNLIVLTVLLYKNNDIKAHFRVRKCGQAVQNNQKIQYYIACSKDINFVKGLCTKSEHSDGILSIKMRQASGTMRCFYAFVFVCIVLLFGLLCCFEDRTCDCAAVWLVLHFVFAVFHMKLSFSFLQPLELF